MRSFRKERVANVIRDIISNAISHRLGDPRIETLTTITRVDMAGDLSVARVFLTVPGGSTVERRTLRAVRHASGYLQRLVAHGLSMRQCPEVRFEIDEAAKTAKKTMELLWDSRAEPLAPDVDGEEAQHPAAGSTRLRESDALRHPPRGGAGDSA